MHTCPPFSAEEGSFVASSSPCVEGKTIGWGEGGGGINVFLWPGIQSAGGSHVPRRRDYYAPLKRFVLLSRGPPLICFRSKSPSGLTLKPRAVGHRYLLLSRFVLFFFFFFSFVDGSRHARDFVQRIVPVTELKRSKILYFIRRDSVRGFRL